MGKKFFFYIYCTISAFFFFSQAKIKNMSSSNHRTKGNEAIKRGDYIAAWQHYTEGLQETPKDPFLWCNRAFACLKAGYPELTLHDSANSEVILAEYSKEDLNDINLIQLRVKGKYRMAEA